jgi:methenyltetrahydromethanopterin cyclohydrolase
MAARFGVRGAFGVDAIWDGRRAWVLEVNPRPPASLELFGAGCFEAHVRGARGLGLSSVPATGDARVKLVLFADRHVCAPDPSWWPAGLVHDVPQPGQEIKRGAPVCTLISATASVPELAERGARLLSALPEAAAVGG